MSSQNPRSPGSRRRIAGERRAGSQQPAAPPPPSSLTRPTKTRTRKPRPSTPPSKTRRQKVRGGGPSWLSVAVLGVLVLVLVALTAYLGLVKWDIRNVREADRVHEATRTAPSVAERAASTILSFDFRSLAADEKAAERYMTPKLRKQYAASMKLATPSARKQGAQVDAVVKASGVSDAEPDRVDVLVYVDQTTRKTAIDSEPKLALNRALFRMKRVDGTWLVDDITSY